MAELQYRTGLVARDVEELIWSKFYQAILARDDFKYFRTYSWTYDDEEIQVEFTHFPYVSFQTNTFSSFGSDAGWNEVEGAIYFVSVDRGTVNIYISSVTIEVAEEIYAKYRVVYPEIGRVEVDTQIWFSFWSKGGSGDPTITKRRLDVPRWNEIRGNYETSTQEQLDLLADQEFDPVKSGKLILWHGVPGTGKTYALRGLAHHWQSWCNFNYFAYPEDFFYSPDYMLSAILKDTTSNYGYPDPDDYELPGFMQKSIRDKKNRWNLFIFEDAGEFLTRDAKDRQGQGLSRLLNLSDGLIGQGLRLLILITTNEPVGKLHEAVVRGGRTSANIEFKELGLDQAEVWAKEHDMELTDIQTNGKHKFTIADLYNSAVPSNLVKHEYGVGFA